MTEMNERKIYNMLLECEINSSDAITSYINKLNYTELNIDGTDESDEYPPDPLFQKLSRAWNSYKLIPERLFKYDN